MDPFWLAANHVGSQVPVLMEKTRWLPTPAGSCHFCCSVINYYVFAACNSLQLVLFMFDNRRCFVADSGFSFFELLSPHYWLSRSRLGPAAYRSCKSRAAVIDKRPGYAAHQIVLSLLCDLETAIAGRHLQGWRDLSR